MGLNASTARELKRSESYLIKTEIEVDCEASKTTAFLWKVYKISQDPVTYQPQSHSPVYIPYKDQSFLHLPATYLQFGFYKLHFTVMMEGVVGISGSAEGYIHVMPTQGALQAVIEGGPRKRYKFGTTVSSVLSCL